MLYNSTDQVTIAPLHLTVLGCCSKRATQNRSSTRAAHKSAFSLCVHTCASAYMCVNRVFSRKKGRDLRTHQELTRRREEQQTYYPHGARTRADIHTLSIFKVDLAVVDSVQRIAYMRVWPGTCRYIHRCGRSARLAVL